MIAPSRRKHAEATAAPRESIVQVMPGPEVLRRPGDPVSHPARFQLRSSLIFYPPANLFTIFDSAVKNPDQKTPSYHVLIN